MPAAHSSAPTFRFSTQMITSGRGVALGHELRPLPADGPDPAMVVPPNDGSVLAQALLDAGWHPPEPGGLVFVTLDRAALLKSMGEALPLPLGRILLPRGLGLDPLMRRRLAWLAKGGHGLVLDGVSRLDDPRWVLVPHLEMVRLDLPAIAAPDLDRLVVKAHAQGVRVLACGVEDAAQMAWLRRRGVEYYQGPLVASALLHQAHALPSCDRGVLGALLKLMQRRAPCERLAEIAVTDPALMLRLFLLQPLLAGDLARYCRTLPALLEAMPYASLHGWVLILSRTAIGQHGSTWSRTVLEQMGRFRMALIVAGQLARREELEMRTFLLYRRMCLARPLAAGLGDLRDCA